MKKKEDYLSISSWYEDIMRKGLSLRDIPENERTLEMCFVAIHYWGASLEYVPDKYKTYELCLDAVRHNTPIDEGCSALAFVPNELRTYELCLEAIRHDYLISAFWESDGVEFDYAAAIHFVPEKFRTPELCFEALIHSPISAPGYFNFVEDISESIIESDAGGQTSVTFATTCPTPIQDILNSFKLFIKVLKEMGLPDEYDQDALKYFEKIKNGT